MVSDKGYAHPEALVSTEWAAENLNNPKVRLIESNEDPLIYAQGHIPGAIQIDWRIRRAPKSRQHSSDKR